MAGIEGKTGWGEKKSKKGWGQREARDYTCPKAVQRFDVIWRVEVVIGGLGA